jgi:hypothetical protein
VEGTKANGGPSRSQSRKHPGKAAYVHDYLSVSTPCIAL